MKTKVKFFRLKQFESIRRVVIEDENGNRIETVAFIGKCKELYENEFIFDDNVKGNEEKWLVIVNDECYRIHEFPTLEFAKEFCREVF